ncbi:transmembrane protein 267-like isoform X1 [Dreissena polymorpha]|uniref:Transmembrane protein 267 n=1 Tax=Dreissena polymorpha TaxID=45954 RepID=A0A9D4MGY1_DREPO|nr:transmembrane protein 267-like isoform X1 [Dreissena polymorpha]XP_052267955.1 transmembrane protein 267-like isoform X1 [Dreissena polymorpha]XP_052267956.1 transmembrane protein 267-like isoform X1 [Dreissena polymorpha]KAH3875484.1 hypothetical protein DPMN_038750 [Dreissena polymorpha]
MLVDTRLFIQEAALVTTCLLGDHLLKSSLARQRYVVAVCDSVTHGLIGGISWAILTNATLCRSDMFQCLVAMMLSMMVDVDHFLAAGSLSLKAALSLPSRPPFHASTVILVTDIILLTLATILKSHRLVTMVMMFTMSWFSHHLRDAERRGLWFYPLGNTPPLPKTVYIGIIVCMTIVFRYLFLYYVRPIAREKIVQTDGIV